MSYDFLPSRKLRISYQITPDGEERILSLPRHSIAVLIALLVLILGVSAYSLVLASRLSGNSSRIKQLEQENAGLRNKVDFYSATVDSIYQMLDLIQSKTAQESKDYPSLGLGEPQPVVLYDARLRHKMEDMEQKLAIILQQISPDITNSAHKLIPIADIPADYIPSIYPTFGRISDGWGLRVHPITNQIEFHYGIDIANQMGTPIYATAKGRVSKIDYDSGYGKRILLDHEGGFVTVYAHLYSYLVRVGDEVGKGQIIGLMGNTGLSTGPHLHYEVRRAEEKLNPTAYLNRIDEPAYAMR